MATQRIPTKTASRSTKQVVPTASKRSTVTRHTSTQTYAKPTDCRAKGGWQNCRVHGDLEKHFKKLADVKQRKGYTPQPGYTGKAMYRESKDFQYTRAAMDDRMLDALDDPNITEGEVHTFLLETKNPAVKAAATAVLAEKQALFDELVSERERAWDALKLAVNEFARQLTDTILIGVLEDLRDVLSERGKTENDYERVEKLNEFIEKWNEGVVRLEHPSAAVNEITKRLVRAVAATNKVTFAEMRRSRGEF